MEPSQNSSAAIPVAIVAGFGLIALAIYFSGIGSAKPGAPELENKQPITQGAASGKIRPVDDTDFIKGNPNASILIVEYSDYDCPFCKDFHETMNRIMQEYGVSGKIAWVYRQLPIAQLHPNSERISQTALCVGELGGNDAFWKFSDKIFSERNISEPTNITRLPEYAEDAGVDRAELISCLESDRHKVTLANSLKDGANAGIQGTPQSFVIVGNQMAPIEGAQPYAVVKQVVENLLSQLEQGQTAEPATTN